MSREKNNLDYKPSTLGFTKLKTTLHRAFSGFFIILTASTYKNPITDFRVLSFRF